MNEFFQYLVDSLRFWAALFNMTYQEINIYLFVIIWPLVTLFFLYGFIKYKRKYTSLNKKYNER